MATWEQIQNGIFAGESGGDYDAVFGFQNRPGGKYESVRLTEMPISAVMEFTNPRGEYGQWVKRQVGRVATPVGAYQVVGTTLRAAVKALGLDPNQKFDKATQDRIGKWILANQGTAAWEGYKGPSDIAPQIQYETSPRDRQDPAQAIPGQPNQLAITRLAYAYANGKMTPEDAAMYEKGMEEGDFPRVMASPQAYQVVQQASRGPDVQLNAGAVAQQPQTLMTIDPLALAAKFSRGGAGLPGLKG